jgi:hypothetical protein
MKMPRAKPKPQRYHDIDPSFLAEMIRGLIEKQPGTSEAFADVKAFEEFEGLLSFQAELQGLWEISSHTVVESALKAFQDPNGMQAFHGVLAGHRENVLAYADAIAQRFPLLCAKMEALKLKVNSPAPETLEGLADYVSALKLTVSTAFEDAEIEIVKTRKEHAKKDIESDKVNKFSVRTGASMQAAIRALSDVSIIRKGARLNTSIEERDGEARHAAQHHHLNHKVIIRQSKNETIEKILSLGGSTACFVFIYVEELIRLADVAGRSNNPRMTPWVTLDIADIVKKTMGEMKNKEELDKAKQKVWGALRLADSTYVLGARNWEYSGNIETKIAAKVFVMGSEERPNDWTPSQWEEPPLRVSMTVTPEWLKQMKTGPIAEYLPSVEILAAIRGGRTAGAWARCLGLAWLYHCRRYAANPSRFPTRRELLDSPLSDVSPYFEVLESPNPLRAIDYFKEAESMLVELGFLAPFPETRKEKTLPRKDWAEDWLSETLEDWKAGPRLMEALEEVKSKMPEPQLLDFKAPKKPTKRAKKKPA